MKVAVYVRQPTPPHQAVGAAVEKGAQSCGEQAWCFTKDDAQSQDADVVVIFGIGGDARQIWDANAHAHRILLDKPYFRGGAPQPTRYHIVRVAVNAFQPLAYFQQIKRSSERWKALDIAVKPYKKGGSHILLDGASNKYCQWNNLGDWAAWGQYQIDRLREYTSLPIIYRPRPSHNAAPQPKGAIVSENRPLDFDMGLARIVVSHGGNIGYDAVVSGIPHFAIDSSIARPVSETFWRHVSRPYIPHEMQRAQWLADLAYCQWTLDEFIEGSAWRYVRETIELDQHLKSRREVLQTP